MKKILTISLCAMLVVAFTFAACSKSDETNGTTAVKDESTATTDGLNTADNEYGFETEDVTDKDGKKVTDKNGNEVTKKNGKPVTVKTETTTKKGSKNNSSKDKTTKTNEATKVSTTEETKATTTEKPTATTKKNVDETKTSDTTKFEGNETVPKTSATGTEVNFSTADMTTVANMLEVPYLYLSSYENSDGVPIDIAAYTAVWMAQHDGGTAETYPSSPVVLNLFKFYGQTVVNFKTQLNKSIKDSPIKYNSKNDTFTVSKYPDKKQTVKITKIEDLGDNNFYKVTADVSGAGKIKKVYAVIQKNKLDSTLGFSIKALNWK